MKNQLFALIGLGLLLATASAYAQTGVVKANVPFNFIVEKTSIPAGTYLIQPRIDRRAHGHREPRSQAHQGGSAEHLPVVNGAEKTKLVFHRYGSQYFLSQIWVAGNDRGSELPTSQRESEVAMDPAPQDVVVVATLR